MATNNLSKAEMDSIRDDIKKELVKELQKTVQKEVLKQVKGDKATREEIKEISVEVLINLFRIMWNRNSMWSKSV